MNTIGSIIANERLHRLPREDEYINETDGFIYCSKCRTPRQAKAELSGRLLTVPVMCK